MGKMHALLAVEANLVNTANSLMKEASETFRSKPDRFEGFTKTVEYFDEARKQENTSEAKQIVTTADDKLDFIVPHIVGMYDALLQKEATNQVAKADIVVDGKTIATAIPATFLLGMETRLKALREVLITIPTLDPTISWTADPNASGKNVFRSPNLQGVKTEKRVEPLVLYPATDKHPAQVKEVTVDSNAAAIKTVKFSGMMSVSRKAEILTRLDALLIGVKQARMNANNVDVISATIGQKLFGYILEGK